MKFLTKVNVPVVLNENRILHAIAVMENVKAKNYAFDLDTWYSSGLDRPNDGVFTEEHIHGCGTTACMFGWVAASSEFRRAGGSVSASRSIHYRGEINNDAAEEWFGTRDIDLVIYSDMLRLSKDMSYVLREELTNATLKLNIEDLSIRDVRVVAYPIYSEHEKFKDGYLDTYNYDPRKVTVDDVLNLMYQIRDHDSLDVEIWSQ